MRRLRRLRKPVGLSRVRRWHTRTMAWRCSIKPPVRSDDEPDQQALDEALAALQHAVALDEGLGYAHAGLGLGYHLLERLDQAQRCLDRAVEVEPELIMGWYHRGDLMRALGDLNEARRCYSQALALDDQCEPARLRLAELSD